MAFTGGAGFHLVSAAGRCDFSHFSGENSCFEFCSSPYFPREKLVAGNSEIGKSIETGVMCQSSGEKNDGRRH